MPLQALRCDAHTHASPHGAPLPPRLHTQGFDYGKRISNEAVVATSDQMPACYGSELSLSECAADTLPSTTAPFEDALVTCSNRRSISVENRSVIAASGYWGLPDNMTVGQPYVVCVHLNNSIILQLIFLATISWATNATPSPTTTTTTGITFTTSTTSTTVIITLTHRRHYRNQSTADTATTTTTTITTAITLTRACALPSRRYTTEPIPQSIFVNLTGSSRATFRLDVVDDPLYVSDPGDFLVDMSSGSILASPRREGLIELVLKARDGVGFETVVYTRRITLESREFGINNASRWTPDVRLIGGWRWRVRGGRGGGGSRLTLHFAALYSCDNVSDDDAF
jgi:hypothetical protein